MNWKNNYIYTQNRNVLLKYNKSKKCAEHYNITQIFLEYVPGKGDKYKEIADCFGVSEILVRKTILKLHKMVNPICQNDKCSSGGNVSPV